MAAVTYDAQSLMVDSRRVWLVGTSIEYTQVPRAQWRQAIRTAKQAGINCITTRAVWNLHEPRPGKFTFEGERDLKHFIEIVGEEGLFCVLRVGPYVGGSMEGGGLPAWLSGVAGMKLREASRPFLDACTRWFAAMMEQVVDLQATHERHGKGGSHPLLLVQVEHDWRCHNPDQATRYMGELIRFLREEGCQVPLIEANNCWQDVEGAFSTWRGNNDLAAHMRQFRIVQQSPPTQHFPLLLSELAVTSQTSESTLAQALAAGAQFNLDTGNNLASLASTRRIATFANQFSNLFAHLHADRPHATIAPQGDDHELAIIHQRGTQGDVIFLLRSERDRKTHVDLLMPDGQSLRVPLGKDRVAWLAFNVNLAGVATLTHTNLRPFAFLDRRLLVLFGPAGEAGTICIDGAEIDVTVPAGSLPLVHVIDNLTVAVLNETQVDASCLVANGLYIGVSQLDAENQPVPHRHFKHAVLISSDGAVQKVKPQAIAKTSITARFSPWTTAAATSLIDGTSDGYRPVAAATALDTLAPTSHHGWYRLALPSGKLGSPLLAPQWSDRIQLFSRGKPLTCLEANQNSPRSPFTLKNASDLVALASLDPRINEGWRLGETKGLAGHLYQVKPVKLAKPSIDEDRMPDPTSWRAFLSDVSYQLNPQAGGWSWTVKPTGKQGLILHIKELPLRVLIVVNDKVVGGYDPIESQGESIITLEIGAAITAARNTIRLALMDSDERLHKLDPRRHVKLYDAMANLTAKAEWSFASLTMPADAEFVRAPNRSPRRLPCWFRTTFQAPTITAPLALELTGLSRGQAWLNGHSLGRFTEQGTFALRASELVTGHNVVTIFEEHGALPRSCKLSVQE